MTQPDIHSQNPPQYPSKLGAQKRLDQILAFEKELKTLNNELGIQIDSDEQDLISAHHQSIKESIKKHWDSDTNLTEKKLSKAMKIASLFGALTLTASICLFFYQIWGNFSQTSQIIIITIAPIIALAGAQFLHHRESSGYFAHILALLSMGCFVLNLSVLGVIYSLEPTPNVFLVWGLFAFLLAFHFKTNLLLIAGILFIGEFFSAQVGTWCGFYWLNFSEHLERFIPTSVAIFCLSFIPHINNHDFAKHLRIWGLLHLFIPLLILSNWGGGSYLSWDHDAIEAFYQVLIFLGSGALAFWGIKKSWSEVTNTAGTFFIISFYTKFFDWFWDIMPKALSFLILSLLSILILTIFKRLRNEKKVIK